MPRAQSRCRKDGCDQLKPCPDHTPKPWAGSTRRSRLPPDWDQRRELVAARAGGRCEGLSFAGESTWHAAGCTGQGSECDHKHRGDNHALDNLAWLSSPCHAEKTRRGL
jgi:5-methylcytosine-specific restriction protein A